MHNNYYFLRQLVPQLEAQLKGSVLAECFSQNKDELILSFRKPDASEFFIKAYLKSHFSCLSFPTDFKRAKKNSASIFDPIIGQQVSHLHLFKNERSFTIHFKSTFSILFKLHGNRSNIILLEQSSPVDLFKNSLRKDLTIDIKILERPLDISFENLLANDWNIRKVWPTLDKSSGDLLLNSLPGQPADQQENIFNTYKNKVESPGKYFVLKTEKGFELSLLNPGGVDFEEYPDPIEAINTFFHQQVSFQTIAGLREKAIANLNAQLVKAGNYVIKSKQKLEQLLTGASNKQIADVLMANIYAIEKGSKEAKLHNFYTDQPILIKLNPLLSVQKNAERYYRKAKNEAKEIAILEGNIKSKEQLIEKLRMDLESLEWLEDIKELKKWLATEVSTKIDAPLPYKEFVIDGYRILVGKNAKQNDELTLKIAKKEDLWLHAKDVSGSHVVVRQIPGTPYPKYIIEKAARLAAYYSKRKTDSLCPVMYTPKKYVRKVKGAPAGAVLVE